ADGVGAAVGDGSVFASAGGGVGAGAGGAGVSGAGGAASGLGPLERAGPHVFLGSVPARNAMVTGLRHVPAAERSTGTTTTPSGIGKSSTGLPASASFMNAVQMGTATLDPVSSFPRLRGLS